MFMYYASHILSCEVTVAHTAAIHSASNTVVSSEMQKKKKEEKTKKMMLSLWDEWFSDLQHRLAIVQAEAR